MSIFTIYSFIVYSYSFYTFKHLGKNALFFVVIALYLYWDDLASNVFSINLKCIKYAKSQRAESDLMIGP